MRKLVLISSLCPLLLAGCTTMSAAECLHANWYETGYQAGRNGHPPGQALKYQSACVHYGILPDREAFANGWAAGARADVTDLVVPADGTSHGPPAPDGVGAIAGPVGS